MKKFYKKYLKLEIDYTKTDHKYTKIVEEIHNDFGIDNNIFVEMQQLNKLLGRFSNKLKIDFVLKEEAIKPTLKINKRIKERLVIRNLEINDTLAKIKTKIESDLRKKHGLSKLDT